MKKRVDWWNLGFIILFISLTYGAFRLVSSTYGIAGSVSLWDTVLMALAAFRLTRLVVNDSITRWVRDFFEDATEYTFMGSLKTLINCSWCVGLWFALVVATAYFVAPFLWFFIYILALSGVASFVQLLANVIGWNAERAKREVGRMDHDS